MSSTTLIVLGALLAGYPLVAARLSRTWLTGPLLFTALGLALGPGGIDLIDLPLGEGSVQLLLNTTLGIVLFYDATRIDLHSLRRGAAAPIRLLAIGFPVMIVVGVLGGRLVFPGLELVTLAAIAVVLAPTDAALGRAVVTNVEVPARDRQTLIVESGLNDGLGLPFLFAVLAVAAAQDATDPGIVLLEQMTSDIGGGLVAGLAVGLGGVVVARLIRRVGLTPSSGALGVTAIGVQVTTAGTALALGGSIFIAAFVAGLVIGPSLRPVDDNVFMLGTEITEFLTMLAFFVFGAAIVSTQLDQFTWQVALYAVLSLAVFRPIAVAVAEIGSDVSWRTIAFLGWFGPRGLGSILYIYTVREQAPDFTGLDTLTTVMTWTVLISIVLHGVTAWPASKRYAASIGPAGEYETGSSAG